MVESNSILIYNHRSVLQPAQARDAGSGSRVISVRDVASNTKLKFRQPGQGTASEVSRRDLKAELAKAERAAINKRKGITEVEEDEEQSTTTSTPLGAIDAATSAAGTTDEDEQAVKRRKLIEEAVELDRDDDSEEEDGETRTSNGANGKTDLKGKGKAVVGHDDDDDEDADDSDDSSDEEEDDEDETAELLRELEKIKRERAEERERQVSRELALEGAGLRIRCKTCN